MLLKAIMLCFLGIFFIGCTPKGAVMIIDSFPQGAQITNLGTNKVKGVTPIRGMASANKINGGNKDIKCKILKGIKARWVSGATAVVKNILVCLDKDNYFMINRPDNANNLEADMQYAKMINNSKLENRKIRALENQAASAYQNARANKRQAIAQEKNNYNQQQQNQQLQNINNYFRYGY
jgi:hypothetical protein